MNYIWQAIVESWPLLLVLAVFGLVAQPWRRPPRG